MSEKWRVAIIMLFAILAAAGGEALAAKGMKATAHPLAEQGVLAQIRAAAGNGHVWIGIGLMTAYVFLYTYTLGLTDLSFALPLSASSYLIGALLSKFYVGENVTPARWIGTGVIVVGVLIVAIFGQSKEGSDGKNSEGQGGGPAGAGQPSPGR